MRPTYLLVAALLGSCPAPVYGCAAAIPIVTAVASVISEISSWVSAADAQAQSTGALPPNYAAALSALRVAIAHLSDAAQQGPAEYAKVVATFERLYADFTAITAPLGVRVAPAQGRMGAAPPATVQVPSAGELGARLRAEGPR